MSLKLQLQSKLLNACGWDNIFEPRCLRSPSLVLEEKMQLSKPNLFEYYTGFLQFLENLEIIEFKKKIIFQAINVLEF